jgi:hypothetical protein
MDRAVVPYDHNRALAVINIEPVPHPQRLIYHIYNFSKRTVDAIWLRPHDNSDVHYEQIAPRSRFVVATYIGHPWIFRDSYDGEHFLVLPDQTTKLVPKLPDPSQGSRVTSVVLRTQSVSSLRRTSIRSIAVSLRNPTLAVELPLPIFVRVSSSFHNIYSLRFIQIELVKYLISSYEYQSRIGKKVYLKDAEHKELKDWLQKTEDKLTKDATEISSGESGRDHSRKRPHKAEQSA